MSLNTEHLVQQVTGTESLNGSDIGLVRDDIPHVVPSRHVHDRHVPDPQLGDVVQPLHHDGNTGEELVLYCTSLRLYMSPNNIRSGAM